MSWKRVRKFPKRQKYLQENPPRKNNPENSVILNIKKRKMQEKLCIFHRFVFLPHFPFFFHFLPFVTRTHLMNEPNGETFSRNFQSNFLFLIFGKSFIFIEWFQENIFLYFLFNWFKVDLMCLWVFGTINIQQKSKGKQGN